MHVVWQGRNSSHPESQALSPATERIQTSRTRCPDLPLTHTTLSNGCSLDQSMSGSVLFPASSCKPGSGEVRVSLLLPSTPNLSTLRYTYPLKLIPSIPHVILSGRRDDSDAEHQREGTKALPRITSVPLLFLLTYGGGLLPQDTIDFSIKLDKGTRLAIATQGSTKIYKFEAVQAPASTCTSPSQQAATQTLSVHLGSLSALLYLPHPTQPFAHSKYRQDQTFTLCVGASLATIDWVSCGREARGERWLMDAYRSKTEVWVEEDIERDAERERGDRFAQPPLPKRRLLLRDTVLLEPSFGASPNHTIPARMEPLTLVATLILIGPVFASLSAFFLREFSLLPRIGARGFDKVAHPMNEHGTAQSRAEEQQAWRQNRLTEEKLHGILWTAASVRDDRAVVVRFGSRDGEAGRRWIKDMIDCEGSVLADWGKGAMGGLS